MTMPTMRIGSSMVIEAGVCSRPYNGVVSFQVPYFHADGHLAGWPSTVRHWRTARRTMLYRPQLGSGAIDDLLRWNSGPRRAGDVCRYACQCGGVERLAL